MSALPVEIQAIVLAELAKRVKTSQAATKAIVGNRYAPGDKQTFRSPVDDAKLGTVFRSDPDPEWRVVDDNALSTYLVDRDEYMEPVAEVLLPSGEIALMHPDDELYRIVSEHAPHLTRSACFRIRDGVVDELVAESKRLGKPAAPGIAKVKPEGVLSVRPDKNAGDAIERMVTAGLITWDGRPVLEVGRDAS